MWPLVDTNWKRFERSTAKALGSTRCGPLGHNSADVHSDRYSISCKYMAHLPKWATDCLAEARAFKKAEGKLPVLIIAEKGMRQQDSLCIMRFSDWQQLENPTPEKPADVLPPAEGALEVGPGGQNKPKDMPW